MLTRQIGCFLLSPKRVVLEGWGRAHYHSGQILDVLPFLPTSLSTLEE